MTENARKLVAYSFLAIFANDREIDADELAMLKRIALDDGEIDEEEKQVLQSLFSRVSREDLADAVRDEIEEFREEHSI